MYHEEGAVGNYETSKAPTNVTCLLKNCVLYAKFILDEGEEWKVHTCLCAHIPSATARERMKSCQRRKFNLKMFIYNNVKPSLGGCLRTL